MDTPNTTAERTGPAKQRARILVAEDERIVAMGLRLHLQNLGYQVVALVPSGEAVIQKADELRPDLVLMDIGLEGLMDGIEAAAQVRQRFQLPVIFLTAYSTQDIVERAKVTEPFGYILKPYQDRELHVVIETALYKHRMEAELRQAKESAESANRAKSAFLAHVSHEVRNSMNNLFLMMGMLETLGLTAEQAHYLQMIKTSGKFALHTLNDLLDFSKIEAGKLQLDTVPFKLVDPLSKVLQAQALRAHPKGLEFVCYVSSAIPAIVVGDPNRLEQILLNLVSNAVKFTARGEVVVRVDVANQSAPEVELHVTVRDTGIGIPADKLQAVFQPFEQAETSTTRRYGGTGLGLHIAAELVALMGGRIWVESLLNEGSTFHFTARFGVSQSLAAGGDQVQLAALRDLPILVVDDNVTSGRVLVETLQDWHMKPMAVTSGPAALAALTRAAAAGQPFPLILIDAHMPEMNGLTLAAQVRQQPDFSGAMILMLLATDRVEDVAHYRELGIAAWLRKPILAPDLGAALLSVLSQCPKIESV